MGTTGPQPMPSAWCLVPCVLCPILDPLSLTLTLSLTLSLTLTLTLSLTLSVGTETLDGSISVEGYSLDSTRSHHHQTSVQQPRYRHTKEQLQNFLPGHLLIMRSYAGLIFRH